MDFRCIFCMGLWYGYKRVFLRVVVWANNADIFIFSLECSHFTLLHDCNLSWQAFASSACQSVNSVFQTQRCKPLSESLLFARRGCRSRFGDSAESRQNVQRAGHWWFSGRILASHAGDPGSIPGQCIAPKYFSHFLLVLPSAQSGQNTTRFWPPGAGKGELKTSRWFWTEDCKEMMSTGALQSSELFGYMEQHLVAGSAATTSLVGSYLSVCFCGPLI